MESELNVFERPAQFCYCVTNGASACAPCRERRAAKAKQSDVVEVNTVAHPYQWLLDAIPEPEAASRDDQVVCFSNGHGGRCGLECSVFLAGRCECQGEAVEHFVFMKEGREWAMRRIEEAPDEWTYLALKNRIDDQRALDGGDQA